MFSFFFFLFFWFFFSFFFSFIIFFFLSLLIIISVKKKKPQFKRVTMGTSVARLAEHLTLGIDTGHDLMGSGIEPHVGLPAQ